MNNIELDLSGLETGIYVVHMLNGKERHTGKVVKL